jgi:hypothetical protein
MLAHQAGGYHSGAGYREMIRQYTARPKPGQLPEDTINDLQVGERAGRTPAELILELRRVGPAAIHNWAYGFRLARWATELIKVPHPVAGKMSIRFLNWVIHSRFTSEQAMAKAEITGDSAMAQAALKDLLILF